MWDDPLIFGDCDKAVASVAVSLHLMAGRRNKLDWLFFRRWRLADGWLSKDQAKRALEIFHDPLAIRVRRAVVDQLHPDQTDFSKYP